MVEKHTVPMQFHPRAFSAFGSDLVTNDYVAINELIKNAYDAYAYKVKLKICENSEGQHSIEIIDDGLGMTQKIIEEAWAVIATPYKKKNPVVERDGKVRVVSGNKGLGRLSSARLGNALEILTKNQNDECITVEINWRALVESTDISACGVVIGSGNENYLLEKLKNELHSSSKTGTILRITDLNTTWEVNKVSALEQSLARLISPFDDVSDFSIFLGQNENAPVQIEANEFIKTPTYYISGTIDEYGNTSWNYSYNLDKKKCENGYISWEEAYGGFSHQKIVTQYNVENIPQYACGPFSFEFRAWDLDSESIGGISDQFSIKKNEIRKTISTYKGISIYRDNVLVLPKSDAAKDWLGVDLRRVSNIGRRLSTNQIIGKVSITEADNPGLKDTTDREKLVDTTEYKQFCYILETLIIQLENLRNRDRVFAKRPGKLVDLIAPIDPVGLESRVEELVKNGQSDEVVEAVHEYSANAEKSIGELKERMEYYAQTASLGSVAFVIMHEIRTGMMVIMRFIKWCKKNITDISPQGKEYCADAEQAHIRLKEVADSFAPLYKKNYLKEDAIVKLDEIIYSSIKLISAKKEAADVEFKYQGYENAYIKMQSGEAQTVILNLLDNSCYWLGRIKDKKTIQICVEEKKDKILVNVSDNGPGIASEDVEKIFIPGTTGKPHGIGMGLVIVTELLDRHDCKIEACIPGDIGGATFIFELPKGEK